jgi:hypothetical protein
MPCTCTDPDIGRLLSRYLLRLLDPEASLIFENHLLECDFCFEELKRNASLIEPRRDAFPEERPSRPKSPNGGYGSY